MHNHTPPKEPPSRRRQIRVLATPRLTHTPYLLIETVGLLPYDVLVVREGAPFKDLAPLWDEMDRDLLTAWVAPWGVSPDDNPWDHVDPNTPCSNDVIQPVHRLPTPMEDTILALI